jgi:hypothetical protein
MFYHRLFFKKVVLLAALFLFQENMQGIVLISLGQDCQAAWRLKQFNLRELAYPFEWLRAYDFYGVCKNIEDRFINFLNPYYLSAFREQVSNTLYGLGFVHDFPTNDTGYIAVENENCGIVVSNYLDYLEQVKKKYQPRIKRFLDALDGNNKVIFIRTHIGPDQAQFFVNMINKYFSQADYRLVVIHEQRALNYNWKIARVENFFISEKEPLCVNNWLSQNEWQNVFMKLGLTEKEVTRSHFSNLLFSSLVID